MPESGLTVWGPIRKKAPAAVLTALAIPIACETMALLRNLLLARLLGVEELGRLMLLLLVLRLAEMGSDLSLEKLMAQARDGGALRLQRNLQGAALLRGLASALLILLLAWPLAASLGDGPDYFSLAALALVPLLRGFLHLDYRRWERNFNFQFAFIVDVGSTFVGFAAIPIALAVHDDHRVILMLAVLQALAAVVLSHTVSRRRYRLSFDRDAFTRIWGFGAPLLLNGLLMFAVLQGDRLIVSYGYTWVEVGRYAVAAQLALLPTLILARGAQSLLLPLFRRKIESGSLGQSANGFRALFLSFGILFLIGYGLIANPLITTLYGPDFRVDPLLCWSLGALGALRMLRTPLSLTAIALGRTKILLQANMWRASALAPAVIIALEGHPVALIALSGAAGELASFFFTWFQLQRGLHLASFVSRSSSPIPEGADA